MALMGAFVLAGLTWILPAAPPPFELRAGQQVLPDKTLGPLAVGMRVRLVKRVPGGLKPEVTGHPRRLAFGPGQRGVVVAFLLGRAVGIEYKSVLVRWDKQVWVEWDIPLHRMKQGRPYSAEELNALTAEDGPPVTLEGFEGAAPADALQEVTEKPAR